MSLDGALLPSQYLGKCIVRERVSDDPADVRLPELAKMSRTRIRIDTETRRYHYPFGLMRLKRRGPMKIGYARTSTVEQIAGLEAQERELRTAGVEKVFSERVSSVAKRE